LLFPNQLLRLLGKRGVKTYIFLWKCCATKIRNAGLDIAIFVSIFESTHMTHGQPISGLKPAKRGEYLCFFDPFYRRNMWENLRIGTIDCQLEYGLI
jgi:hypothetical protein